MSRLLWFPLIAAFCAAIWTMRYDWTYDETYHYGWTVLPLALYLFSLRWRDRPAPGLPLPAPWLTTGWVMLAACYPAAWILREANPEWRLLAVGLAGLAVLTALQYLAAAGGQRWVRHFAGPVLFFLTSIPWPSVIEKAATAVLMPANAAIALEVLHWINVPAIRSGHIITIAGGTLGVEEACSGIRSLQSTLMMAFFLGELHQLRPSRRLLLFACGIVFALFTNTLRTIFLSAAAARAGLSAAHTWHDTVGFLALGANVLCLFFLTARFTRRAAAPAAPADRSAPIFQIRGWPVGLLALALIAMFPLTAWWYSRHETLAAPLWHLEPPLTAPGYRSAPINDRTQSLLRYSRGWSARWNTAPGQPLHGFYFQWSPGRVPPENLNVHQPGNCLGTIGIKFVAEYAPIPITVEGQLHTARHLRFDDAGRPLHLLYLFSEDTRPAATSSPETSPFDFSYRQRLTAALQGRRNPGQRLLETGLWDEPSEANARIAFTAILQQWLKPGPGR
jgi:exosortase